MNPLGRHIILFALIQLMVILGPSYARACTCAAPSIDQTKIAVKGYIRSLTIDNEDRSVRGSMAIGRMTVSNVLKGDVQKEIVVMTGLYAGTCGGIGEMFTAVTNNLEIELLLEQSDDFPSAYGFSMCSFLKLWPSSQLEQARRNRARTHQ
jgi:hypothetical protein